MGGCGCSNTDARARDGWWPVWGEFIFIFVWAIGMTSCFVNRYHADVVSAVAFAPVSAQLCWAGHCGWLASGSRDGTVAMWAVFPVKEKGDGGDGDAVE